MTSPRKFRVWSNELKQWITHCVVLAPDGVVLTHSVAVHDDGKIEHRINLAEPLKPVVERWTGQFDKDGKEVYEGDILECTWLEGLWAYEGDGVLKRAVTSVRYRMGCLSVPNHPGYFDPPQVSCGRENWKNTVIGNIHETPELLPTK